MPPTSTQERPSEVHRDRRVWRLDYVKVKGASLENGLLHVDLVREIPEAMKPRSIPIASSSKLLEVKPTKVAA
jgi:molecular chaperone IbpA